MMFQQFCQYIRKGCLFDGCKRFLVALSGGVDSVVLADLMRRYAAEHRETEVAWVHCNFRLRGAESDRDEAFVRAMAESFGQLLFVESFDTRAYASEHKISIEMAARELRYNLFAKLMRERGYDACLLAHHADDNAETFFINLFRGSGVKGLRGMLPRTSGGVGKSVYLRPLLFARRARIEDYALRHNLAFVQDSTNCEEIYLRNKIRHSVLPLLEEVSEGFTEKLSQTMGSLRAADDLLDDWYARLTARLVEPCGKDTEFVSREALSEAGAHKNLFWELYLRERGFSRAQIGQMIVNSESGISGKRFENTDGSAVLYRESKGWRYVGKAGAAPAEGNTAGVFSAEVFSAEEPENRQYELLITAKNEIDPSPHKAYLNFEKLHFPLTWRHPEPGDRFMPLGTRGFKKLGDFFKDEKIGAVERASAWLLCSGEDIVWVAGFRLDHRYKLNPDGVTPCRAWVVEVL